MIRQLNTFLKTLISKSKMVFLLDGLGAALTSILLIAVLKPWNEYFGMPKNYLLILSIFAFGLALYSLSCFRFLKNNHRKFLKLLIFLNVSYIIFTLILIINFYHDLTILGLLYFTLEILIIGGLVFIERKSLLHKNVSKKLISLNYKNQ